MSDRVRSVSAAAFATDALSCHRVGRILKRRSLERSYSDSLVMRFVEETYASQPCYLLHRQHLLQRSDAHHNGLRRPQPVDLRAQQRQLRRLPAHRRLAAGGAVSLTSPCDIPFAMPRAAYTGRYENGCTTRGGRCRPRAQLGGVGGGLPLEDDDAPAVAQQLRAHLGSGRIVASGTEGQNLVANPV